MKCVIVWEYNTVWIKITNPNHIIGKEFSRYSEMSN